MRTSQNLTTPGQSPGMHGPIQRGILLVYDTYVYHGNFCMSAKLSAFFSSANCPPWLFPLHTPAIVKVFGMVGWPVLSPICLLKVRKVARFHTPKLRLLCFSYILSTAVSVCFSLYVCVSLSLSIEKWFRN